MSGTAKNVQRNLKKLLTLCPPPEIVALHTVTKTQNMRTKSILAVAAILATGAVASMAQSNVYSLNVVGYVNITVPANTKIMIANQLNTTNNTLAGVLPTAPDGAQFNKFNSGFTTYTFDELEPGWLPDGNVSLAPGEGGFFQSPIATTLTFVGEVKQGSLTNTLPIGVKVIRGSIVPQAGTASALGIVGEDGDQINVYNGGFTTYTYDELEPGWLPSEPSFTVGQGFFYQKSSTALNPNWVRNFTVQ